jgi:hypothetical protein
LVHKRNIALIALFTAAPLTLALTWLPFMHRSDVIGVFYFPAIVLSVLLSGGTHSPSSWSIWASSLTYTLLYLVVFVLVYAVMLEIYLLKSGASRLEHIGLLDSEQLDARGAIEAVGAAVHDVEARRRRHWVLQDEPRIDLSESHLTRGARVLAEGGAAKTEAAMVAALHDKLRRKWGEAGAQAVMQRLNTESRTLRQAAV